MRRGFMLVTVMIITAVGLLFGAGALLMFRYQCQMRIDRQHELEKVYAVRSALNYIKGEAVALAEAGETGVPLRYHTGSDRDLGLLIKPVDAIFPNTNNASHFNMGRSGQLQIPCPRNYNSRLDYEYGALHTVSNWALAVSAKDNSGRFGLAFKDLTATNQRWWVNIGMRGTGGWLQEDYGRRYYFCPLEYVDGKSVTKDIVRLCLIRNVTNESNAVGYRHGWPLSQNGERAIVFQIAPKPGGSPDINNADMSLYEYACIGSSVTMNLLISITNCPSQCYMGMQLADDKVCLFYRSNKQQNALLASPMGGFVFSETKAMSVATYNYFAKEVFVGGKQYGGVFTNDEMRVEAPELRAVFEVEAASDARPHQNDQEDFVRDFRVTPAYQYDVFLEHPYTVTNRATVAQIIGTYERFSGNQFTVLTYDTHGTENKGFRRDEREHARGVGQ
ncbi:MAG: hypothetical protein IKU71_03250 [Kiritimatiellae bacterium]|nr:hypothetical protein [Kiritimatiellia bacterium]